MEGKEREIFVTATFAKSLKRLAKKYPSLKKLYKKMLEKLSKSLLGDEIQGHQNYYKVRYANVDAQKGKSGGFRLIYFYYIQYDQIILVDIYSKTQQIEVDWDLVKRAMEEMENG